MTDYRKRLEADIANPFGNYADEPASTLALVTIADLRSLLSEAEAAVGRAMTSNAHKNEIERLLIAERAENARLRSLVEEAGKVVEPFARIAPCFDRHIMVEVCEPHPDNPSPRIQPLTVGSLVNARSLSTKLKGED